MLRLKGDPLSGGPVRGYINLTQMENQAYSGSGGMTHVSGSEDHLSNSVYVMKGSPPPEALSTLAEGTSMFSECGFIFEKPSRGLANLLSGWSASAVAGIPSDYFRAGDPVCINGADGTVEMDNICAREVVSCLVQSGGKTLILKRSESVGSWQGKWAAVSGYIEEGETPTDTAFKEMKEELSVERPTLVRRGSPIVTRKEGIVWVSHPFLFALDDGDSDIKIDWEHADFRWITLDELPGFDTVPGLGRMLSALGLS